MLNEILLSDCIMAEIQFSINSSNDEISNGGIDNVDNKDASRACANRTKTMLSLYPMVCYRDS